LVSWFLLVGGSGKLSKRRPSVRRRGKHNRTRDARGHLQGFQFDRANERTLQQSLAAVMREAAQA
jgi:hypothetical protein